MVKKINEPRKENMKQKILRLSKDIGFDCNILKTDDDIVNAERVKSGYPTIDYLLRGGLERGSFISLYGGQASLKTTVGLKMLAEAQKRGDECLIVNIEEGFNKTRLTQLGVDTSKVAILDQKMSGEEYYELLSQLIKEFDFILIDSVSAMMPKIDDDKTLDEGTIRGMEATMHARGLRKMNKHKLGCVVVMIAHEKQKVNSHVPATYMPGGKGLEHYSNYILNFKRKKKFDIEWNEIGANINKERKTKVEGYEISIIGIKVRNSHPNTNINAQISLRDGSTRRGYEMAKLGLLTGVIQQGGSYYKLDWIEDSVQGMDALAHLIEEDNKIYEKLYKAIMGTIEL